jgi:hypothetical protein
MPHHHAARLNGRCRRITLCARSVGVAAAA